MEMLLKVKSAFGNFEHLDEKLDQTTFQFGDKEISLNQDSDYDDLENFIVETIMEGILDDYETHACKALVDHGLHGLEPITPKPVDTHTAAHKSHVALWLCSIALVIVLLGMMYLVATRTEVGIRMYDRLRG